MGCLSRNLASAPKILNPAPLATSGAKILYAFLRSVLFKRICLLYLLKSTERTKRCWIKYFGGFLLLLTPPKKQGS